MSVIAMLLLSAAAPEQQTAPPPNSGETIVVTGELPEDRKPVCKPVEEIGSIIPRRVCRTKSEWASLARDTERRTRDYVNNKNAMSGRTVRTIMKEGRQAGGAVGGK